MAEGADLTVDALLRRSLSYEKTGSLWLTE